MGTGRSRPRSGSQLPKNNPDNISNLGSYRGTDQNRSESGGFDDRERLEYKEKGSMDSERNDSQEKRKSSSGGTEVESGLPDVGEGEDSKGSQVSGTGQGSLDGEKPLEDASKAHVGEGEEFKDIQVSGTGQGSSDGERPLEEASKALDPKEEAEGPSGDTSEDSRDFDIDNTVQGNAEGVESKVEGSKQEEKTSEENKKEEKEIDLKSENSKKETKTSEENEKDEDLVAEEKQDSELKEKDNYGSEKQKVGISHGAKVSVSHGAHSKPPPSQGVSTPKEWPWPTNATSVDQVVEEVWGEIDDQCQLFPLSNNGLTQTLTGWKVVRLFVSSTFHDFQNEREILVKKVFPELKEWCEKRRIHFIECDLRWGVPRDSTTRTVLCTCMEEIDRCHEDTQGEAFFLNMLGERYGWVPTKDDVPEDIAKKYDWVGNSSITHMEILHGAYRFCNRNAAFFLREVEGMPDDIRAKFADPTDLGLQQIDRLRTKLASRFLEQCRNYTCQYDPTDTSCIKLTGLEQFGADVLHFFKFAIDRKYPEEASERTPEQEENDRQTMYLGHKGQLIYGREREICYLYHYVTGSGDYSCKSLAEQWQAGFQPEKGEAEEKNEGESNEKTDNAEKERETKEESTDDSKEEKTSHPPIAVVAQSGQGKSSLMARFIMEAKQDGLNVFFHLIGCSGESLSLTKMLGRLCRHLAPSEDERLSKVDEMSSKDLAKLSNTLIKEYIEEGKQLVIVIDDLTQLELDGAEWSDWIPQTLEGSVYMVFSLVEEERKMADIKAKVPSIQYLKLNHLDHCARVTIVENYFAQYNKKLDPGQLEILTRSQGAENALWLALACEELRVFGAFEKLTELIRSLPDNLEGLVCDILHRLVLEDETGLVEKTLCYLECCPKGLTEYELQCMLGENETKTPVLRLHLAMVRRTLKPFLRKISGMCKLECITFFHHAIGWVVRSKWLSEKAELEKYHLSMADFYQNWYEHDPSYAAKNAAYHFSKSNDKARLVEFLTKDKRSWYLGAVMKSNYLKACRCRTMINKKGSFHTQLFMCNFCGPQRKAFGNEGWPNAESCMLCGHFVSPMFRKEDNKAYRCQQHPMKGPRFPNVKTCMLCSRTIMKGQEKPAYLCHFCQLGGFPTCCNLNTDKR